MATSGTFYVIDFDRTLGSVEASFSLLKQVAHDLGVVDDHMLQHARERVEASGGSFSALEYIKDYSGDVDVNKLGNAYLERAIASGKDLLEPGARDFIDFLYANSKPFCIMSFGDPLWQDLKIIAAGLGDIPKIIVSNRYKGQIISDWRNEASELFAIPAACFGDGVSRIMSEIVLIDDKAVAFDGLPEVGARGYLVKHGVQTRSQLGTVPASVVTVSSMSQIISKEQ